MVTQRINPDKVDNLVRAGECLLFAWAYLDTTIDGPILPYATLVAVRKGFEALEEART